MAPPYTEDIKSQLGGLFVWKKSGYSPLTQQVNDGVKYFTGKFISKTRNDLTAAEFHFGKAD